MCPELGWALLVWLGAAVLAAVLMPRRKVRR